MFGLNDTLEDNSDFEFLNELCVSDGYSVDESDFDVSTLLEKDIMYVTSKRKERRNASSQILYR